MRNAPLSLLLLLLAASARLAEAQPAPAAPPQAAQPAQPEPVAGDTATVPTAPAPTRAAAEPEPDIDAVTGPSESPFDEGDTVQAGVKSLLMLGFVILLAYLLLNVVLRRVLGIRGSPVGRLGLVEVLERAPLEQKKSLYVVKAGGKYLLVGTAEEGVSLLGELDADTVLPALARRSSPGAVASHPLFAKFLAGRKKPS